MLRALLLLFGCAVVSLGFGLFWHPALLVVFYLCLGGMCLVVALYILALATGKAPAAFHVIVAPQRPHDQRSNTQRSKATPAKPS
ncbi:hypothetical protein [Candidatus Symbiobacter mobilis]|uniref:Uncharacterized protein n=1 Tax=Candidatus Symbiobacter mobilis CR TaxID=946483 RepID=U5NB89_9BURK|nr:hypothetical protein [Candidatus Symbiobacter mobilis]AGX87503.1 hypothetical protein Cenrod_1416 [Candidatus Symbiobacter mobilis CR]